jgi:hypothetical protein
MSKKKRKEIDDEPIKMDPELADAICDGLPLGAYFAMMEELTGMEPADLADYDWEGDDE